MSDSNNSSYFTMATHFQTLDPQLIEKLHEKDNWLAQLLEKMHKQDRSKDKKKSVPSILKKERSLDHKTLYRAKLTLPKLIQPRNNIVKPQKSDSTTKKRTIETDQTRQNRIYELYGFPKQKKKYLGTRMKSLSPQSSIIKNTSLIKNRSGQAQLPQKVQQYEEYLYKIMLSDVDPNQIAKSQLQVKQIKGKFNHLEHFNKAYYSKQNHHDLKLIN